MATASTLAAKPQAAHRTKESSPTGVGARNSSLADPPIAPDMADRPGVIDGSAEVSTLRGLEGVVTGGRDYSSGGRPNPATTMMLGPMVRGAEVRIK